MAKRIAFECDRLSRQHQTQKPNRHLLDIELSETKLIDGILWHEVTPRIRNANITRTHYTIVRMTNVMALYYCVRYRAQRTEEKKKRDQIISAENCVPTGSGANSRIINGMRIFLERVYQESTKPSQAKPAQRIKQSLDSTFIHFWS